MIAALVLAPLGLAAPAANPVKPRIITEPTKHDTGDPAIWNNQDPSAVLLRFAVLGDAEPKPEPVFPGLRAAVADINRMAGHMRLDFVVGVGDIAHKGTLLQYEAATRVPEKLTRPFYPIMGNEEHGSTVGRFLEFAARWNRGKVAFPSARYVVETDAIAFVFASPDFGREFNDDGVSWILQELRRRPARPVFLIVHGAQTGVYPENPEKGIAHPGFAEVVAQANLAAVISGDLHMDMERVDHSKQIGHVHYLHIPGLERTKIPDETRHEPMFRVFTLYGNGRVVVDTYRTGMVEPLARHAYGFALPRLTKASTTASTF
jgi:3',5'-cyclic-AMP phosphodiesterase